MKNPMDTLRRYKSRLGKPIRPIIELQKGGKVVNILTTPIQTENMINDTYHTDAWEVHSYDEASSIYVDGVFKGMGFFAGEEGTILKCKKDVRDETGQTMVFAYKGIFGELLDASLIERGSALKPSMTQTLIYCLLVGGVMFMAGMSYA
jgi:hypothetical protein